MGNRSRPVGTGSFPLPHSGKNVSLPGAPSPSLLAQAVGVVVRSDGNRAKYATAHDLRRSVAERLYDAGVPERIITQVMRHASATTTQRYYAPVNVQKAAGLLREQLTAVPGYTVTSELTQVQHAQVDSNHRPTD